MVTVPILLPITMALVPGCDEFKSWMIVNDTQHYIVTDAVRTDSEAPGPPTGNRLGDALVKPLSSKTENLPPDLFPLKVEGTMPTYIIEAFVFVPDEKGSESFFGESGKKLRGRLSDRIFVREYTWEELDREKWRIIIPERSPTSS